MNNDISLEEALEICLAHLASGEMTLEACLALFPHYTDDLRPLLATAQSLHPATYPTATPQQVQKIWGRIRQKVNPHKPSLRYMPMPIMRWGWRAAASLVVILVGVVILLIENDQLDGGLFSSAVRRQTPTPSPTPEMLLSVKIVFGGQVDSVSKQSLIIAGVPVQSPLALSSGITPGMWLVVEGELLDDGVILAETLTPSAGELPPVCPLETDAPCHPSLWMLAVHFEKPYAELEELRRRDLDIGEIARLLILEQASGEPLESLFAERQTGKDWGAMLQDRPEIPPEALQVVIRQRPANH